MSQIRRQLGFHAQCILSMCTAPTFVTSLVESMVDAFVDGTHKQFSDVRVPPNRRWTLIQQRVDALDRTVASVLAVLHGNEDSSKLGPKARRLLECCEDDVSGDYSMATLSTYLGHILTIARRVGPQGNAIPDVRGTTMLLTHALYFEQKQLFTADELAALGLSLADFGGRKTEQPQRVNPCTLKRIRVGAVRCAAMLACARDENVISKLDEVADATSDSLPVARQRADLELFEPWVEE